MRRTGRFLIPLALATLCGCSHQAREDRALARAAQDVASDDYSRAEIEYRKAISLVPTDSHPMASLGILYLRQGRYRLAYSWLKHAIDSEPAAATGAEKASLAEAEVMLGGIRQGHDDALAALKSAPGNEQAWTVLSRSARTSQQVLEARALLESFHGRPEIDDIHDLILASFESDPGKAEAAAKAYLARHPDSAAGHSARMALAARRHDNATALAELRLAVQHSPLHSPYRILEVDALARTGAKAEARQRIEELNVKVPDFVLAWLARLQVEAADKRFDEALKAAQEVLSRDPGNFEGLSAKGSLLLQKGDAKSAIAAYSDAIAAYPRVPMFHFQLGTAYLRHREVPQAETQFNTALSLDPHYSAAAILLAEIDLNRDRPEAARLRLAMLVKAAPTIPQAYVDLGRAYVLEKDYDGAINTFRAMRKAFPKLPDPDYRMGLVYLEKKDREAARAALERAVQLAPTADMVQELLLNLDLTDGNVAAARERVKSMRVREPHSASPWLLSAKIDLVAKDREAAKRDLNQAIAADPNVSESYSLLSRLMMADRQTDAAGGELKAMAVQTHSARGYLQYGLFLVAQHKYAEAKSVLEQAVAADGQFVPALTTLAWIEVEYLQQFDQAEQHARRARELAPEDSNTARSLGWVLLKKHEVREALALLQEAADAQPTDADARFRLGVAHYLLGLEDEARSDFLRTLSSGPDPTLKTSTERLMALLRYVPSKADSAAEAALGKRVAADPLDLPALKRLAVLEDLSGKSASAADHYRALLRINPGSIDVLMHLATLYAGALHDPAKAIETAKLAHEKAPDDPKIALSLGRLAAQVGAHAWAVDLLGQAERGQPEDLSLTYDLAWEYSAIGKLDRAAEIAAGLPGDLASGGHIPVRQFISLVKATEADELSPEVVRQAEAISKRDSRFVPALMILGRSKEADASIADAEAFYSRILQEAPAFYPARRRMAVLLFQKGRYADAADSFRQTQNDSHFSALETYSFGMSLYHIKDPAAQLQLRHALVLGLPESESAEARRALKDLSDHAL